MNDLKGMLEFTCDVERLPNGNTLITDAGEERGIGSEILEVDPVGQIVWRYGEGLNFAHSAKRLTDGSTLLSDTNNDRILIVSQQGEILFTSDDWGGGTGTLSDGSHLLYPNDAHQLDDGSFLITDRNNDRCVIAGKDGKVLWQFDQGIKHPHNADMLPNGNVLLVNSDENTVIEVNREKEVVWSYGDSTRKMLSFPRDADRLENGNTLITDSRNHRVIEVTPEGEIVWEYKVDYYASFYEADPLPNGNVLIADQHHHQVLEVDRSGTIVWQFRNRRLFRENYARLKNGFFTQWKEDELPEGWHLYTRFAEGGGEYYPLVEGDKKWPGLCYDRKGALCLVQYVKVTSGEHYTFAGQIKTEDIHEDAVAYFQLFFLDEQGGPISNTAEAPRGTPFSGSQNWTEDSFEADAPQNARSVEIRLFINGPGKVWMRNLMFFS